MNVLALHGFLGQGTDWNPLMDLLPPRLKWVMPSLFKSNTNIRLSSIENFIQDIQQMEMKSPKILMGYSMGGRLALEVFKKNPEDWEALVLFSAHPGIYYEEERQARAEQIKVWRDRFENWRWNDLLSAWNSQPVLKNSEPLKLKEENYDRDKLCQALSNVSLDKQKLDVPFLKAQQDKIWFHVGKNDKKYLEIYSELNRREIIKNLSIYDGLGHRLLQDGVQDLATQLEAQLEL